MYVCVCVCVYVCVYTHIHIYIYVYIFIYIYIHIRRQCRRTEGADAILGFWLRMVKIPFAEIIAPGTILPTRYLI